MKTPRISICVPFHWMKDWQLFLLRCLQSIEKQDFKDYEVILINYSTMPETSNRVIQEAKGEIVKVLYMDDWLESEDYLTRIDKIFNNLDVNWVITSATTNRIPMWTDDIEKGNNKLGSPSALAFRNRFDNNELFDEELSWMLDCDLYKRLERVFGQPTIATNALVGIGVHEGQMTNILTQDQKMKEVNYLLKKYE